MNMRKPAVSFAKGPPRVRYIKRFKGQILKVLFYDDYEIARFRHEDFLEKNGLLRILEGRPRDDTTNDDQEDYPDATVDDRHVDSSSREPSQCSPPKASDTKPLSRMTRGQSDDSEQASDKENQTTSSSLATTSTIGKKSGRLNPLPHLSPATRDSAEFQDIVDDRRVDSSSTEEPPLAQSKVHDAKSLPPLSGQSNDSEQADHKECKPTSPVSTGTDETVSGGNLSPLDLRRAMRVRDRLGGQTRRTSRHKRERQSPTQSSPKPPKFQDLMQRTRSQPILRSEIRAKSSSNTTTKQSSLSHTSSSSGTSASTPFLPNLLGVTVFSIESEASYR